MGSPVPNAGIEKIRNRLEQALRRGLAGPTRPLSVSSLLPPSRGGTDTKTAGFRPAVLVSDYGRVLYGLHKGEATRLLPVRLLGFSLCCSSRIGISRIASPSLSPSLLPPGRRAGSGLPPQRRAQAPPQRRARRGPPSTPARACRATRARAGRGPCSLRRTPRRPTADRGRAGGRGGRGGGRREGARDTGLS